jgi:hypothetical protein
MRRIQGWDPVLIISQIISLQTIHYLALSLLIPPVLQWTTDPQALAYAGGPRVTSYVLDWREIASRSTAPKLPRHPPGEGAGRRRERRGGVDETLMRDSSMWYTSQQQTTNATTSTPPLLRPAAQHLHRRYGDNDAPSHYPVTNDNNDHYEVWDHGVSFTRGWLLAGLWVLVSILE